MSENRKRNWLKISCIGCVGAPCLVLMLSFGIVKCQISKIGDRLPGELAKLKAMGVATEPADLKPAPPVPDTANAAILYKKIFALSKQIAGKGKSTDGSVLNAYTGHPSDTAAYEDALKRYQPVFDLANGLTQLRQYAPDRKYEEGFDLLFPEFADMKDLVKRESARTRYLLDKGRRAEALQALDVQYSVSDHLSQEPSLIGSLVCIAVNAIANVNLDVYLEAIQDDAGLLEQTEAMLLRHQSLPSFRRAMEGEFVLGRLGVRRLRSWNEFSYAEGFDHVSDRQSWERTLDSATLGDSSFRRMLEAKLAEAYTQFFAMLPEKPNDWLAINAAVKKFDAKISADNSLENRVNQILFPVFDQASMAFGKMDAQNRVALLAVKLLRMRSGGLPPDLSQFGTLAIDPLTGKKMGYVRKGDGFKVWSVGQDLDDDGGTKRGPKTNINDTDIVMGYRIGFPARSRTPVRLPPAVPGGAPGVIGP